MPEKKLSFWKKKENWGLLVAAISGLKFFTKPHTAVYQVADYSLTFAFPAVMLWLGVGAAKKYGTPSGLSKMTDGISNLLKRK